MPLSLPKPLETIRNKSLTGLPVRPRFWMRRPIGDDRNGRRIKTTGGPDPRIWDGWFTSPAVGRVQWLKDGNYTGMPTDVYPGDKYTVEFNIANVGDQGATLYADMTVPGEAAHEKEFFNMYVGPNVTMSTPASVTKTTERKLIFTPGRDINGQRTWGMSREVAVFEKQRPASSPPSGGGGASAGGATQLVLNLTDSQNHGSGDPNFHMVQGEGYKCSGILRDANYNGISNKRVEIKGLPGGGFTLITDRGGQWTESRGTQWDHTGPVTVDVHFAGGDGWAASDASQTIIVEPAPGDAGAPPPDGAPSNGGPEGDPGSSGGWSWPLVTWLQGLFTKK